MKIVIWLVKALAFVLVTAAKAMGAMGGARTTDMSNQLHLYKQRDEYRP
jgi:hypothetical protein